MRPAPFVIIPNVPPRDLIAVPVTHRFKGFTSRSAAQRPRGHRSIEGPHEQGNTAAPTSAVSLICRRHSEYLTHGETHLSPAQ